MLNPHEHSDRPHPRRSHGAGHSPRHPGVCENCPVAIAMSRALGVDVHVTRLCFWIGRRWFPNSTQVHEWIAALTRASMSNPFPST